MSGEVLALVVMSLINSISKSSEMGTGLKGIKVPVIGRSGAGDAMTAAMVLGEEKGMPPEERLRYAIASASAKIMVAGTQPPERETVEEMLPKVIVTNMKG